MFVTNGVSFSNGINTVQWNATSANAHYNWNSSGNMRAPRWYKILKIDNTQLTTGTHFDMIIRLEHGGANDFNQIILLGPAIDPTSTVDTTILGSGGLFQKLVGGNPQYGSWTVNNSTRVGSALADYGKTVAHWGGDSMGSLPTTIFDSSNVAINSTSRNSGRNALTAGTTTIVYVMLGLVIF